MVFVSNEVFIGAGAMATLAPECDIFLHQCDIVGSVATLDGAVDDDFLLVPGLYKGCIAKCYVNATQNQGGSVALTQYLVIKDNDSTTITFDEDITAKGTIASAANKSNIHILSYGAPLPGPKNGNKTTLLSDHWMGLVNTFNPPNVEVEMKQLNLATAGRNFGFQFKGSETVSGGSIDVSLNNGSWLYYTLGKYTIDATMDGSGSHIHASQEGTYVNAGDESIIRAIGGAFYPPIYTTSGSGEELDLVPAYRETTDTTDADFHLVQASNISNGVETKLYTYDYDEVNGAALPSFAIELCYAKDGRTATTVVDDDTNNSNMFARVFTGNQVNSLAINFEEGQEVKASVDFVTRRAFDVPGASASSTFDGHIPNRGKLEASELLNFGTDAENQPFMFSSGAIKVFGQTFARVKTGNITINNNLNPHRFIGNYSREVTSMHVPGQRTYDASFTMLITDTKVWDELRKETEHSSGVIEVAFTKDSGESLTLQLSDYLVQSVNVPLPDDKGAIEVEMAVTARTLGTCQYKGRWHTLSIGGVATSE